MRVVFYSVSVSRYGAPTSMLNLIEGLSRYREYEIVVVVPQHGPLTDRLKNLNVRILVLPHYKWIYRAKYYQDLKHRNRLLALAWFYKNKLKKLGLNLLYLPLHLWHVKRARPDLIYINASMSPVGALVGKILGIKLLWHHREPVNDPETDFYIEWNKDLSARIMNWAFVRVYNSKFLEGMYTSMPARPFPGKSYVVYNGVPVARGTVSRHREGVVFGMVGKIEAGLRKGQSEVLAVFAELDRGNITLNIYGDGEPAYVNSLKRSYPQDGIHFCGFKTPEQVYPEIDFLIMNSRNESFGRVVAEAFAYGVPVLALRSGALPEIVDEDKTGYVYENLEQLKKLILSMVDIHATHRYKELSDACITKYKDTFTIEKYTQNIINVLSLSK